MIKLNYAGDGSILRMPDGGYEINVCGEEGSDGKQIMRTCYALTMNDAMRCFVNLNFELGNIDTLGEDEVGHMCLEFAPDGVYAIERVYPPVLTGSAMMQPPYRVEAPSNNPGRGTSWAEQPPCMCSKCINFRPCLMARAHNARLMGPEGNFAAGV